MLAYAESIPDHIEHRFRTPDGRTLTAAEWGDPDGLPLIAFHGTPGGRISWWKDPTIYRRYGLRRITIDRAGYGESTRLPGRTVADVVRDVVVIADSLGIDRFVTSGGSGGGPHTLAVAAMLGDRVIRCHADVSVAPFGDDGLSEAEWLAGQAEGNVAEFQAARKGEAAAFELCDHLRTIALERFAADRLDWMGDGYDLSDADVAQEKRHYDRIRAHIANGLAHGSAGWVDDNIAFTSPWGFGVDEVRVPVLLTYGRTDVLVPAAHGDWLAAHIAGAVVRVDDDAGHFGDDANIDRDFAWLAGRSSP